MHYSTHERRVVAPLHYLARADNARFCAYQLWRLADRQLEVNGNDCGYGGSCHIAAWEGYLREAAVALELILKALIAYGLCSNSEKAVAARLMQEKYLHHDLPKLWDAANLPSLSEKNQVRLHTFASILYWSGKYPTPRSANDAKKEEEKLSPLLKPLRKGPLGITPSVGLGWNDFDRIYKVVIENYSDRQV